MSDDRAGVTYWEDAYRTGGYGGTRLDFDPLEPGLRRHWKRAFHAYFRDTFEAVFGTARLEGRRLLEVGCGASAYLPYFARQFGLTVGGLDYSPLGCERARERLRASGVEGDVVCADLFSPPDRVVGSADVVVSFGVAEHFDDTASCVRACAALLRPGGVIITTVPYMGGMTGLFQRALDPRVYATHRRLTPAALRAAHEVVGLDVLDARYVMFANLGVVNVSPSQPLAARVVHRVLRGATAALWLAERAAPRLLRPNAATSPYSFCAAVKPG